MFSLLLASLSNNNITPHEPKRRRGATPIPAPTFHVLLYLKKNLFLLHFALKEVQNVKDKKLEEIEMENRTQRHIDALKWGENI